MSLGRKIAPVLALVVLSLLAVPTAHGSDLLSAQAELGFGFEQLTGSWHGTTNLGVTFLLTFHPDRTYNVSFNLPGTGGGHGHGAWDRTGLTTFSLTDLSLVLDADNELVLLQKTRADATVDGDQAEFELQVELTLPDGTPVDTFPVVAQGTRIVVEPLP